MDIYSVILQKINNLFVSAWSGAIQMFGRRDSQLNALVSFMLIELISWCSRRKKLRFKQIKRNIVEKFNILLLVAMAKIFDDLLNTDNIRSITIFYLCGHESVKILTNPSLPVPPIIQKTVNELFARYECNNTKH